MKRFDFPLETALKWRRSQLEMAEATLRKLIGDRALAANQLLALHQSTLEERTAVQSAKADAAERQSLAEYIRWAKNRKTKIEMQVLELDRQIAAQRVEVERCRRNCELLEKLKARKRSEWQAGADREVEQLAADSYLSRLARDGY